MESKTVNLKPCQCNCCRNWQKVQGFMHAENKKLREGFAREFFRGMKAGVIHDEMNKSTELSRKIIEGAEF